MKVYYGKYVFQGISIGKICILKKENRQVEKIHIDDTMSEVKRAEAAVEQAQSELAQLYEKALAEVGETEAMIFEVHKMMLGDEDYLDSIRNIITAQNVNSEYAVKVTGDNYAAMFAEMEDDYMKAREADVKDISERVINILSGKTEATLHSDDMTIIVAEDLSPSETIRLDKSKVIAFVTRLGSSNSHSAILARTMNIPALINIDYDDDIDGKLAIVDGFYGKLVVEPDEKILSEYRKELKKEEEKKLLLQEYKGKETITKSGKLINLYANIGNMADITNVLENDAEGIGLLRSEFLYLGKNTFPTEEEQFLVYKALAEKMAGKKVIIRTLDIGADKQAEYFHLDHEANPAMGYRAIRICLEQPEIFKTQLRAIFRASIYGRISIMYPMIISVEEIKRIKTIVEEVKEELDNLKINYADVEQGIMVETPAAVMVSDLLAREVDFFSIGTNDLTQYTLAIDRQNTKLDSFYNSHHEAILRMIRIAVENAHQEGIWVGICGELGADTALTETFVKMGIDELSVSPVFILPIRKIIRNMD